jgi:sialidase-1
MIAFNYFALFIPAARAAAPSIEKNDLFQAGVDGYTRYRIPGLVITRQGTLLAYCEGRMGSSGDWNKQDHFLRRSTDGGRTWEARRQVAHFGPAVPKNPAAVAQKLGTGPAAGQTVDNPTAIAETKSNAVHFLYCVEYQRAFWMLSDDDGKTFSAPVDITSAFEKFRPEYDWKVFAIGPNHGIQLANGRLVVAVWLSEGTGDQAHRPSVTSVIYSDDGGKTWDRGDIALPNTDEWVNPNESVLIQLADGSVMLNGRTESKTHRRLITVSKDGATGWSKPRFQDELLEPICMGAITRVSMEPNGRNRILFSNPDTLEKSSGKAEPGMRRDRKNLSLKLSYDEGASWTVNKVLEPGRSGYSDLAVGPDGTIYCFYERIDDSIQDPARRTFLTVARFNLEWLTDGKDSLEKKSAAPQALR